MSNFAVSQFFVIVGDFVDILKTAIDVFSSFSQFLSVFTNDGFWAQKCIKID